MKKYLICILLIMVIFISGCGKKDNEEKNNQPKENENIEVKVEDLTIKLNSKRDYKDMSFMIPGDAQDMNIGTYFMADYMNGTDFIFRLAIYYNENKTIEDTMGGLTSKGNKTINGIKWYLYDDVSQNGEDVITYVCEHNKSAYSITFIHVKNIDSFIDAFMNTVKFK